jgi:hypothetical protein
MTTREEIETWSKEPNWAKKRRKRLARISSGRTALKADDDYLSGKVADFRERRNFAVIPRIAQTRVLANSPPPHQPGGPT